MNKSIMPQSPFYKTERFPGSHCHHIFYGTGCRHASEEYGLFIYLTPEMHNMSNYGIHFNKSFDLAIKRVAQRAAMDFYGWSVREFVEIFGKNYL